MDSWTILRLPKKKGEKVHIRLSPIAFGGIVLIIAVLTFLTSFLYTRQCIISDYLAELKYINRNLEFAKGKELNQNNNLSQQTLEREQQRAIEKIRSEYEASLAVIRSKLNDLLELESKARKMLNMPNRQSSSDASITEGIGSGKGGPIGKSGLQRYAYDWALSTRSAYYLNPRANADQILEVINRLKSNLSDVIRQSQIQQAKVESTPAGWPILRRIGRIESNFGYRRDPFTYRIRHHDGIDISAPYGTPVVAVGRGTVKFAGWEGDYGKMVIIDHGNGYQTAYAHLSKISVTPGQKVEKGTVIGAIGSTGRSTGPHLHFEVRVGKQVVNPYKFLSR